MVKNYGEISADAILLKEKYNNVQIEKLESPHSIQNYSDRHYYGFHRRMARLSNVYLSYIYRVSYVYPTYILRISYVERRRKEGGASSDAPPSVILIRL